MRRIPASSSAWARIARFYLTAISLQLQYLLQIILSRSPAPNWRKQVPETSIHTSFRPALFWPSSQTWDIGRAASEEKLYVLQVQLLRRMRMVWLFWATTFLSFTRSFPSLTQKIVLKLLKTPERNYIESFHFNLYLIIHLQQIFQFYLSSSRYVAAWVEIYDIPVFDQSINAWLTCFKSVWIDF